jgi:hypothetical protein
MNVCFVPQLNVLILLESSEMFESEEVDIIGCINGLGNAIYLVSDRITSSELRIVLDIIQSTQRGVSSPNS